MRRTARNFRDKAQMKSVLRAAGVPCARHRLADSATAAAGFAKEVGFPLVVKPPAGAGAKSTFRLDDADDLRVWLDAAPPTPDRLALLEEFLTGDEGSYDSVMMDGQIVWDSVSSYLPTPLEVLRNPWIQWMVLLPRDIDGPEYDGIRAIAPTALRALGLRTGLTHLEWFRRPDGTVAVSEVAVRPPGAQITSMLCYAHDFDLYRAWAQLMVHGSFAPPERGWSVGTVFLRGQGTGHVRAVHGLDELPRRGELPRRRVTPAGAGPAVLGKLRGRRLHHRPAPRHRRRHRRDAAAGHRRARRARLTTMNILMISPGYPAEMAFFARGLAAAGASVIGVGDQPPSAVPAIARDALAHYMQVGSLAAEDAVAATVRELARQVRVDRVECLWEPYMMLAARLREELGLPGLTVAQTVPFRDKERMKQLLDAAGLRTPRHDATGTVAGVWAAAERLGFPLIVKPIAGAGSADTYRADSAADLDAILPMLRHVPQVSVEEFVDAEEFTYDTICADGQVLFENICWYRPRPLLTKMHEWISPIDVALRDLDAPDLQGGRALGAAVLQVLGFRDGFTHMEWYRKADGEVVFGEIAARPPGGRMVDLMNYATDADLFVGLGGGCHARADLAADRAALQRREHLQAGRGRWPDHGIRGSRRPAGRVRRARGRG